MDGTDNFYSRFVTAAKIFLPMSALALLSVIFLFARAPSDEPQIPYAEIEDIAREPRMTEPHFAGIADDGSVIAIRAEEIRPDPDTPDAFAIARVRAEIDAQDGSRVEISAGVGRIDPRAERAELSGLARLTSSSGYEMETLGLVADLATGEIVSTGRLEVRTPFGALTAGAVRIALSEDGTGQQMVFNEGVRLLYRP